MTFAIKSKSGIIDYRLRIRSKPVADITDDEYMKCFMLTLTGQGGSGSMQSELVRIKQTGGEGRVIMAKKGNILAGWALTFPDPRPKPGNPYLYVMVHPNHRRQGIGERLYLHALRFSPTYQTFPWDYKSECFFEKMWDLEQQRKV